MAQLDKQPVLDIKPLGVAKDFTFNQGSASPMTLWVAPAGRRVVLDDVLLSGLNKNAGYIYCALQIRTDTGWTTVFGDGRSGLGTIKNSHAFSGKLISNRGNGTEATIRFVKVEGTSTNFIYSITLVGRILKN